MELPSSRFLSPSTTVDPGSKDWREVPQKMTLTLPPLRQVLPEEFPKTNGGCSLQYRCYSPSTEPNPVSSRNEWLSPPQNKRRRLSEDDDHLVVSQETRQPVAGKSGSTTYNERNSPLSISPPSSHTKTYSPSEGSHFPSRESQYLPPPQPMCSHAAAYPSVRAERPSLPSLFADRRDQYPPGPDYTFEGRGDIYKSIHSSRGHPYDPSPAYSQPPYAYGYQQPRGQPYPGSNLHDRVPFSSGYHPLLRDEYQHEMGHDSKQRKRRGNLPKETTDKLRQWFVHHLTHPYPTEDEKQDLMRQTGLQMNQISNWFINARRRQLPAMISNARAESDARSAQTADRSNHSGSQEDQKYSTESDEELSPGPYESYEGLRETGKLKREFAMS